MKINEVKDFNEVKELIEKRNELREKLKDIACKGNISPEEEKMLRVFAFGMKLNNYDIKDVLIASDAFSTFLALWRDEDVRNIALKVVDAQIND